MHQLAPEEIGEFTVVGVVNGIVEAGETVSGLELGFRNGDVEMVGVVGTKFGMVVMGVVISLWTVEIEAVNSCFP